MIKDMSYGIVGVKSYIESIGYRMKAISASPEVNLWCRLTRVQSEPFDHNTDRIDIGVLKFYSFTNGTDYKFIGSKLIEASGMDERDLESWMDGEFQDELDRQFFSVKEKYP